MAKILFITNKDFFGKKIESYGVDVLEPFKKINSVFKIFRILHFKYNLGFKSIWYNKLKNLNEYDIVILAAMEFTIPLAFEIEKKVNRTGTRLILWYWNPVKPMYAPSLVSQRWEKWTFDKDDSENFGMKYNGTYYFDMDLTIYSKELVDVFFIGLDKGRFEELNKLNLFLKSFDLITDFHVVSNTKEVIKNEKYKERITYSAVLEKVMNSRAILELMQDNQTGLTLRTMESLYFSKKLITSNKTIVNYNFYKKENIFVLGVDDHNEIKHFVTTPYVPVDDLLISQYNFENWKNRLVNNIELNDELKEIICK